MGFESLDPCHRRLTPFLDQWKTLQNKNPEIPHFFLWLETQHVPKYIPRVTYLDRDDLEKRRIVIKDGLFWEKSDSEWSLADFNLPGRRYLFSINLAKDIYVAEESLGISHSSFTKGQPVLGAGLLQLNRGQLISLALESGHFMPTLEIGHQILKIFEEKGAIFPNKMEITFFYDRNKYKTFLEANPLSNFIKFKKDLEATYDSQVNGCYEQKTK